MPEIWIFAESGIISQNAVLIQPKVGLGKDPEKGDHFNDFADDLDREEPGESEDEEVKRADGHLGRDEQIETRAFFYNQIWVQCLDGRNIYVIFRITFDA